MSTKTPTMGLTCPVSTDYMDPSVFAGNFEIIDGLFPVGSIVMNTTGVNPGTYIGGVWKTIEGRFLVGASTSSSTFAAGTTGGSSDMGMTPNGSDSDASARHDAGIVDSSGVDASAVHYGGRVMVSTAGYTKEYLPPYKAVYIWERTA